MSGKELAVTWAEQAKNFADGAERARLAGDAQAHAILSEAAAECAEMAQQLERKIAALAEPARGAGDG